MYILSYIMLYTCICVYIYVYIYIHTHTYMVSLMAQMIKNLPSMQETWI